MKKTLFSIRPGVGSITFLLLLHFFVAIAHSQTFGKDYYRLTTQWLGSGRSLDVINDGTNNKVHLAATSNATGQFWKITPAGDGYYRLTTEWLGESKSLDVVNDGVNNKLQLAATSNATGQLWKITPLGNGFYRLTTKWLGEGRSLDVVNEGANDKLQLADTRNVSGQFWHIASTSPEPASSTKRNFKTITLSGFKVMVDTDQAEKPDTRQALAILSKGLETITKIVPAKHVEKLTKVPIWLEYKLSTDGAVWYHRSRDWLVANGYPAELEKSIEIKCIRNFIDWQQDQPMMVLHELAHGYQDLYLSQMQGKIAEAYEKALAGGKYNSVRHVRGNMRRAYALNDDAEYFAELTEAYFGKNDFYPFTRGELKEFDPLGFKLMQEAWD